MVKSHVSIKVITVLSHQLFLGLILMLHKYYAILMNHYWCVRGQWENKLHSDTYYVTYWDIVLSMVDASTYTRILEQESNIDLTHHLSNYIRFQT